VAQSEAAADVTRDPPPPSPEELLTRASLFADLKRVDLARLASQLELVEVADGNEVVRQGEPGDALYVVASGSFGVFGASPDDKPEIRLATLDPGAVFGEMALFTDDRRSATVRAEGSGRVFSLARDRFLELLRREPEIFLSVAVTLSRRLQATNTARLEDEQFIAARLNQALDRLAPDRRADVLEAAILEEPSPRALEGLFGARMDAVARDLVALQIVGEGAAAGLRALRDLLEREAGRADLRARAARIVARLTAARCWNEALGVLAVHGSPDAFGAVLGHALRDVPPLPSADARRWIERVSDIDALHDPELALARSAMYEARGDPAQAADLLRRALGVALIARDNAAGQRLSAEIARVSASVGQSGAAARFGLEPPSERVEGSRLRALLCLGASGALAALAAWPGAEPGWTFSFLLLAAVLLMMSRVVPEFAAGLALVAGWLLFGVAAPMEALGGFASKEWLFVLAIYGLAAATACSGVLFRVGLLLVRRLPTGLVPQTATLMLTGFALTPLVPSSTGRVGLTSPLALAVAEALRLPERGKGAAVLGLGTWVGAGPLMFTFLNGSGTCLLAWGLLPEASRLRATWVNWFVAAAPLGVFLCLGALGLLLLLFRPETIAPPSQERLRLQVAILGPPGPREVGTISILILTVAGWIVSPWLGLDLALVALLGLLGVVAVGSFDLRAFQALDWNFLLFFGVVLTIGSLAAAQGIDRAAAGAITRLLGGLTPGPLLFVLAVATVSLGLRLVMDQQLTVLLGSMTLIPVAPRVGVDPWIVVVTLLATSVVWFLPSQTPSYLVAHSASEGRLFSHAQARRFAIAYAGLTLAGLALSIPYWRLLGLLTHP
jgi:CRP-like cAMP-binding protein/di/tricarboxylate transporter